METLKLKFYWCAVNVTINPFRKIEKADFWGSSNSTNLNISNWRNACVKPFNLGIIRNLIKYSLKIALVKAMFTVTVLKILQLKNLIYPERLIAKKSPFKKPVINFLCDYVINQILHEILESGKFFFSLFSEWLYSLKLIIEKIINLLKTANVFKD